jgi:hypothetical protein
MSEHYFPLALARVVCEMDAANASEGIGPDTTELMNYIFTAYPDLATEFPELAKYSKGGDR